MLEPPGLLPKGADPRPWLRVGVPLYVFPDMATGESRVVNKESGSLSRPGVARCGGVGGRQTKGHLTMYSDISLPGGGGSRERENYKGAWPIAAPEILCGRA